MRSIFINRPKRLTACLMNWPICLDSKAVLKTKNGTSVQLQIDEQSHRLSIHCGKVPYDLNEVTIPQGDQDYYFQIDLMGTKSLAEVLPVLRPVPNISENAKDYHETTLHIGLMLTRQLLREDLLRSLQTDGNSYLQLQLNDTGWNLDLCDGWKSVRITSEDYYRFNGMLVRLSGIKSAPLDHGMTTTPSGRQQLLQTVLQVFGAAVPGYQVVGDRITAKQKVKQTVSQETAPEPVSGSQTVPKENPDPDLYQVFLRSFTDKIKTIKCLRENLGLGLKEARELTEHLPALIKATEHQQAARHLTQALEAYGCSVELRAPSAPAKEKHRFQTDEPVEIYENGVYVNTAAFLDRIQPGKVLEANSVIPLDSANPAIVLYEDFAEKQKYVLVSDDGLSFTGKYFHIGVRLYLLGKDLCPVVQIDGFVSERKDDHAMTSDELGFRFEGYCLDVQKAKKVLFLLNTMGKDLGFRGLRYSGITTPGNVRYVGVCSECHKSFVFRGYNVYLTQQEPAYSDDGLDTIILPDNAAEKLGPVKENWAFELDGKTYRYYNSFRCPHCGKPYIDYDKDRDMKKFGVVACVHSGHGLKQLPQSWGPETDPEQLDDVTYIRSIHHTEQLQGPAKWHRYNIQIAAKGYGWDYMLDTADYMAKADFPKIMEVVASDPGSARNITEAYARHGSFTGLPELKAEAGTLSIAGISKIIQKPVKIIWINQTNMLQIFSLESDETLIRKYVESLLRRNFGTKDEMKLGKPIPEGR